MPEILPEKGIGVAVLVNWTCTAIIAQLFPILREAIQIQGCFLIFGAFCVAGMLYIIAFVKETKGKTFEEVEALYLGGNNQKKLLDYDQLSSATDV